MQVAYNDYDGDSAGLRGYVQLINTRTPPPPCLVCRCHAVFLCWYVCIVSFSSSYSFH